MCSAGICDQIGTNKIWVLYLHTKGPMATTIHQTRVCSRHLDQLRAGHVLLNTPAKVHMILAVPPGGTSWDTPQPKG